MNERVKIWAEAVRKYFGELPTAKKYAMAGVTAVILTGAILTTLALSKDPYRDLYTDLVPEDSKAIAKKLGELNIPYEISNDRKEIRIPGSQIELARIELAKEGLPGQDVVGFEKFDSLSFGMSSYVQRIQYVRAVQGELTRSIQRIGAVKRSRVHISLPPKKTFLEEQDPPKASVILELNRGQELSKAEIKGIAHLVSSAVEGLKTKQVTIVDQHGKFLHKPNGEDDEGISTALLERQRSIEKVYERRIVELLSPLVGVGKVMAKVTAEIDPARVNTVEESYDPNRTVALSSDRIDEVSSGSRPNPLGIPGSRTNLPGSEVQNPPIPMAQSNTEKNKNNTRYAVPKKIQQIAKPAGGIKRLTVAVVVDGYYNGAPQQGGAFSPRTEDELRRIQDIVANAVGYDPQRRDSINVSSLPFNSGNILSPETVTPPVNYQNLLEQVIKNGVIAFVVLLFFLLVVRPFVRWMTVNEVEKEVLQMPQTVAELESAREDEQVLALAEKVSHMEEPEPLEKKEHDELKQKVALLLEKSPKKGLQIVHEWLDSDAQLKAVGA